MTRPRRSPPARARSPSSWTACWARLSCRPAKKLPCRLLGEALLPADEEASCRLTKKLPCRLTNRQPRRLLGEAPLPAHEEAPLPTGESAALTGSGNRKRHR